MESLHSTVLQICFERYSAIPPSGYGLAVRFAITGIVGFENWTVFRSRSNLSCAWIINLEWNAPLVFSAMYVASWDRKTFWHAAISAAGPEMTTCPGALRLATSTWS